jgi:hypothetical protein
LNDADNNNDLSGGDVSTVTFNSCQMPEEVVDGTMIFRVDEVEGSVASQIFPILISGTVEFLDYSVTEGSVTSSAEGLAQFGFELIDEVNERGSLRTLDLYVDTGRGLAGTFIDLESISSFDNNLQEATTTFNGTLDANGYGEVAIATLEPMITRVNEASAYQGSFSVTGLNGSSVTVTAIDSQLVRLDVDTDGDGVTDETIDSTWSDFQY